MGSFNDFPYVSAYPAGRATRSAPASRRKAGYRQPYRPPNPAAVRDATVRKIGHQPTGHTVFGGVPAEEQRREERPQNRTMCPFRDHMPLEKVHAGRSLSGEIFMILLHRLGEILARPVKAFAEIRLHPCHAPCYDGRKCNARKGNSCRKSCPPKSSTPQNKGAKYPWRKSMKIPYGSPCRDPARARRPGRDPPRAGFITKA